MNARHARKYLIDLDISLRTYEVCYLAILLEPVSLLEVPMCHRDYNLCSTVFDENNYRCNLLETHELLEHVPLEHRDKLMCIKAIRQNPFNLKYVPEELKCRTICEIAVGEHGEVLEYVPEVYKDKEMCYISLRKYTDPLKFMPEEMRVITLLNRSI
jgi:hypothetical protein